MIISISNQKGGVGKTTTALNIGAFLAKKAKKVLLIDLDPQANLTSGLGYSHKNDGQNGQQKSIYDVLINGEIAEKVFISTRIPNLFLLPSSIELAGAEIDMVSQLNRESILKRALKTIRNQFDYIIIDCPPSLGLITINAFTASDEILIPVQCEYFALEGLGQLLNTVKLVKTNLNSRLDIGGVLLTMYDARTKLSESIINEVKEFFGPKVFNTIIPRNIRLSESPSHGLTIEEYDSNSTGSKAYESLTNEIIEKIK